MLLSVRMCPKTGGLGSCRHLSFLHYRVRVFCVTTETFHRGLSQGRCVCVASQLSWVLCWGRVRVDVGPCRRLFYAAEGDLGYGSKREASASCPQLLHQDP